VNIRKEQPNDIQAIIDVTIAAFADHPISKQTEHFIVNALREANVLTLSLVSEFDDKIVGHIAFSPVTITDGTNDWYGLGPVSVLPSLQKRGIGSALIKQGLAFLKELGGKGCALVGDPDYYLRFGFKNYPQLVHEGIPPEFFFVLPFDADVPAGKVIFHESFKATG